MGGNPTALDSRPRTKARAIQVTSPKAMGINSKSMRRLRVGAEASEGLPR